MIDSHAHLDDEAFDDDRDQVINALYENGIDFIVNIACDLKSSKTSQELAKTYENIYATVGVHPHDAITYTDEVEETLKILAQEKKVVAVGEIGLDYYYDNSPRHIQKDVFKRQLKLANELRKNVVVHSRDASQDTFDILKEAHDKYEFKAVIHCYSQSLEMLKEYLRLGDYISLGGAVTFKNSKIRKEVAKIVPLDRLLLETDCPYMTPVPYRGKRNEPKYVNIVAEYIADLRGISKSDLVKVTDENTKRFYNIC
ncbi:TatD family hydrolase [Peptoniphilus lacrimalis]|uniref:Hydrolase, TatD family n=1 Tax=Peptoniphilus lacrimalis 315-B TaxID=596330 RepID=D1VVP7_9FIRM|nr:TatD family hydrolase [Peptoniphilus lacrimalis]EFA89375.1 hydrolase, TatD family [Peptoniphilus lacrimalis 315-B]